MIFSDNPAKIPQLVFTHAGRFHADDVFSTALLKILRPDIRVYRGFQVPKGFSGIVYDIGNGPFDHHEKGSPRRENGTPYAAFGLLWREYGRHILSEEEALRFDEKFIQPMDADDNLGTGHLLGTLIGAFNPVWDDVNPDEDKAFFEAVDVAEKILYHRLNSIAAVERGRVEVDKELAKMKDKIVVLEKYVPWKPVLVPSEAEFVVFPSMRGGFSVQCIPFEMTAKSANKVSLPKEWCGRLPEELKEISGIPDIKFCHASGFMASADSLNGALAICKIAKEQQLAKAEKQKK